MDERSRLILPGDDFEEASDTWDFTGAWVGSSDVIAFWWDTKALAGAVIWRRSDGSEMRLSEWPLVAPLDDGQMETVWAFLAGLPWADLGSGWERIAK